MNGFNGCFFKSNYTNRQSQSGIFNAGKDWLKLHGQTYFSERNQERRHGNEFVTTKLCTV